jgi:hypothetical protein
MARKAKKEPVFVVFVPEDDMRQLGQRFQLQLALHTFWRFRTKFQQHLEGLVRGSEVDEGVELA